MMAAPVEQFYRQRKVLVTGHTGFKGAWLTAWLKLLGADVTGFALPPETEPNLFTAARTGEDMAGVFGDVRDLASVSTVLAEHAPEIVIHAAAQSLVRRSYREPVETYTTNILGTVNILEAVRHTPSVRAVVIITSDKCYANREVSRGYREDDALGGHDPYSSSKAAAELVTAAYRRSFFAEKQSAAIASARAGNVIGGGDWSEDRLIPDIVRGISSGKPIIIRRPDSVRPWQHVLEPLRGYLMLAQRLFEQGNGFAGAWNFGPREQDALPVAEIARRIIARWGKGNLQIQAGPDPLHEAQTLTLNCEKAEKELDWRPMLTLDETLEWTARWYQSFYMDSRSGKSISEEQIEKYMKVTNV